MGVGTSLIGIISIVIGCRYFCWPDRVHDAWLALRSGSRSAGRVNRERMVTIYRIVGAVFLLFGIYVIVRHGLASR